MIRVNAPFGTFHVGDGVPAGHLSFPIGPCSFRRFKPFLRRHNLSQGGNTICFETQQGVGDACSATQPFTFKKLTSLGSLDYKIAPDVLV